MSKKFSLVSYNMNSINFEHYHPKNKKGKRQKYSSSLLLKKNENEIKKILNKPMFNKKKKKSLFKQFKLFT